MASESSSAERTREGLVYGLLAYGWWGLVPIYFKAVPSEVSPREVLAHRILWTAIFVGVILTVMRRWSTIASAGRHAPTMTLLIVSSCLIAGNWLTYIAAVYTNQIRQASLGFFMTPLVNTLLALVFLGERLRPLQWVSVGLASVSVCLLMALNGEIPWIAFGLAATFSFYSLVRKKTQIDGLAGLFIESAILVPLALGMWLYWNHEGTMRFGQESRGLDALIALSGVVTGVPLLMFGQAARRLPLSTLGFMQYISPFIQLMLAVTFYGEAVSVAGWWSFGVIWLALAVYTYDSARVFRGKTL